MTYAGTAKAALQIVQKIKNSVSFVGLFFVSLYAAAASGMVIVHGFHGMFMLSIPLHIIAAFFVSHVPKLMQILLFAISSGIYAYLLYSLGSKFGGSMPKMPDLHLRANRLSQP